MKTLRTGVWPTILVCGYATAYLLATPERPHRVFLLATVMAALAASVAIARLPLDRVIRGVWCEPFFFGWSASLILMICACAWLDGGVESPLAILFFLPLVYAALSYPLKTMLLVGVVDVAAFTALAAFGPPAAFDQVFLFSGGLLNAAWMCAWQARNHDLHRRALERASLTDPLTGCLNRRGLEERFATRRAWARREQQNFALIVLDLDDFKAVNDRHGHAAGDELLRWVAATLHGVVREEDVVARLGGDEFAVLANGLQGVLVAKRIAAALAERVSVSVGVAEFPGDGPDLDDLHLVADAKLYGQKRTRPRPSWVEAGRR